MNKQAAGYFFNIIILHTLLLLSRINGSGERNQTGKNIIAKNEVALLFFREKCHTLANKKNEGWIHAHAFFSTVILLKHEKRIHTHTHTRSFS